MYNTTKINKEEYTKLMSSMKEENKRYTRYVMNSIEFRIKQVLDEIRNKRIFFMIKNMFRYLKKKLKRKEDSGMEKSENSNYFSDERIAIYSCVTGEYDTIREPIIKPDNCDFYMITDQEVSKDSAWTFIDINKVLPQEDLSSKDKNRYIKMHPEKLFSEYKFSIYIDGNIRPVTDFTEFIQRLPKCGIATFRHPNNDCVYQEGKNCVSAKKAKADEIKKHLNYLRDNGMPSHNGLAHCALIVREHNNEMCKKIMDDWWKQYKNHSKRDQISFAYVLFKQGIQVKEITILGDNLYKNYAVRVFPHFFNE